MSPLRPVLATAIATALLAPPALATPAPDAVPAPTPAAVGMTPIVLRDPWIAAAWSAGTPVALLAASPVLAGWPLVAMPLGAGAGHLYAGDPLRGALFGMGGYAVAIGATLGAAALLDRRTSGASREPAPSSGNLFVGFGAAMGQAIGNAMLAGAVGLGATLVYGGVAAWDAYGVVDRANALARLEPIVTEAGRLGLAPGLTYEEVAGRFGRPGVEVRFAREGAKTRATYRWPNADGSWAEAAFEDGRLTGTTGQGLR